MIVVTTHFGDGFSSVRVVGHDSPDAEGRICAAVTAIFQTAVLGLEQIALQYPAEVSCEITEAADDGVPHESGAAGGPR